MQSLYMEVRVHVHACYREPNKSGDFHALRGPKGSKGVDILRFNIIARIVVVGNFV